MPPPLANVQPEALSQRRRGVCGRRRLSRMALGPLLTTEVADANPPFLDSSVLKICRAKFATGFRLLSSSAATGAALARGTVVGRPQSCHLSHHSPSIDPRAWPPCTPLCKPNFKVRAAPEQGRRAVFPHWLDLTVMLFNTCAQPQETGQRTAAAASAARVSIII